MSRKVAARNLDFTTDEIMLRSFFKQVGPVNWVRIYVDQQGNNKGHALIEYEKLEDAEKAVSQLNGLILNGKKIQVSISTEPKISNKEDIDEKNEGKNDSASQILEALRKILEFVDNKLPRNKKFENIPFDMRQSVNMPPDIRQSFNMQPDNSQSFNMQPDNSQSFYMQPDNSQSFYMQPDNIQSFNTQPNIRQSFNMQPDIGQLVNKQFFNGFFDDKQFGGIQFDTIPFINNQFNRINDAPAFNSIYINPEAFNIHIWNETKQIIQSGIYTDVNGNSHNIRKKINESNKNTKFIPTTVSYSKTMYHLFRDKKSWGNNEIKIISSLIQITEEDSLSAALRIKSEINANVCVLNSSSPLYAGGGVLKGYPSQEATFSRCSSLYFSLKSKPEMYDYHKKNPSLFNSDSMIFSPNVIVFRDKDYNLIHPQKISFISAAAVNYTELLKKFPNGEKDNDVYTIMKNRCRKILEAAIIYDNKGIVLSAFGCGYLKNKVEMIIKIFKELLFDEFYGMQFQKIVFAIKGKENQENEYYKKFKSAFKSQQ